MKIRTATLLFRTTYRYMLTSGTSLPSYPADGYDAVVYWRRGTKVMDILDGLSFIYIELHKLYKQIEGYFDMAKSSNSTMPDMIQYRLNDDELTAYEQWFAANSDKWQKALVNFIADGHKIGISWDDNNACFIASATAKGDTNPNTGQCLLSRSDDWIEALMMNVFKHHEIFGGRKWRNGNSRDSRG